MNSCIVDDVLNVCYNFKHLTPKYLNMYSLTYFSINFLNTKSSSHKNIDKYIRRKILHLSILRKKLDSKIDFFSNLKSLIVRISNIQNNTLDLSNLPNLEYLDCSFGELENLDITNVNNLVYLDCSHNYLRSLNLGEQSKLKILYCQNNRLNKIFFQNKKTIINLEVFVCCGNNINKLQVVSPKLKILDCSYNRLNLLNIDNCFNLRYIYCSHNHIKSLNIIGPIKICKYIGLNYNYITHLNIDKIIRIKKICLMNIQQTYKKKIIVTTKIDEESNKFIYNYDPNIIYLKISGLENTYIDKMKCDGIILELLKKKYFKNLIEAEVRYCVWPKK